MNLEIVVLAAGHGRRMRSKKPKVLHELGGKPLLQHVLDTAMALNPSTIHVVVPKALDIFCNAITDVNVNWVVQEEQLGTAHAVMQVMNYVDEESQLLILLGDVPLIPREALEDCVRKTDSGVTVISAVFREPNEMGRLVRDTEGELLAIIESRDLEPSQWGIDEINSGMLCTSARFCKRALLELDRDNLQGEYYLTDLVRVARNHGEPVQVHQVPDYLDVFGVNTRGQLAFLERIYQRRIVDSLMDNGVSFRDPSRVDVRGVVETGVDCNVDINVVFEGSVILGDDVQIGPNCVLRDVEIGSGTSIHANSHIVGAVIGSDCEIGPFARVRSGTELSEDTHIGNFVEIKMSKLGRGVKAGHLAYIGDAQIGDGSIVGAGAITCNFDGAKKNRTQIGDRVFIGTNSTLVAPLEIASGAFIAAGSTITKRVVENELVVGRSRQRAIRGWQRPT